MVLAMSSIKDQIKALRVDYSQIKFDLEPKKEKRLYSGYKISPKEKILAYFVKMAPLGFAILDGIIVTEKSLYFNPKHCKDKTSNQIPLDRLCQYIVSQDGEKGAVFLFETAEKRIEVFGKAILDNTSGGEIAHFLESVQTIILENDPANAALYHQTVQNFIEQCRLIFKHTGMSIELHNALIDLSFKDEYRTEVATLLAENYARQLNTEGYHQRMKIFLNWLPEVLCVELRSMHEKFITEFNSDLEDLTNDFTNDYLEEAFASKKSDPTPSEASLLCLGLLAVRTMQFSELYGILEKIQDLGQADRIRYFRGIYSNQLMQRAIRSIQNGKKLDKNLLNLSDGIGLTPLHYALILKENAAVQQLLALGIWKPVLIEHSDELSNTYDYINLAQFKQIGVRDEVLCSVSDLMRSYLKDKKALEKKKTYANILTANAQKESDKTVMAVVAEGAGQWAEDLCSQLDEIEEEIQSCTETLVTAAQDAVERWQHTEDPLTAYLVRLYSNPEFLYFELHREPADFALYHYGKFYFVAPKDAGIESKDISELDGDECSGIEFVEKPYGDSWFSPEAHSDISILRAEYYKLAQKYRPDVSSQTYSSQIFKGILQEYAEIIDALETKK